MENEDRNRLDPPERKLSKGEIFELALRDAEDESLETLNAGEEIYDGLFEKHDI